MSSTKLSHEEIKICFNRLSNTDSDRTQLFQKYPNGFYINVEADAASFFTETVTIPTKRDILSKFISQLDLVKKISTTKLAISIPEKPFEKINALKLINESLVVWTDLHVFKIPASEKALQRIRESKLKTNLLNEIDNSISDYFVIPEFITINESLILQSKKCQQITFDRKYYLPLDNFLSDYFKIIFSNNYPQQSQYIGLQHGDLHINNIFIDDNNKYKIIDIDMVQEKGYPFLDLMHFAVHLIRTVEQTDQYEPFEKFLKEKTFLYTAIKKLGFTKLADIWVKYYRDEYINLYIDSQLNWYQKNKIQTKEIEQLETIKKINSVCI